MTTTDISFSDKGFWAKVKRSMRAAGKKILEPALTLYYALIDSDTPLWAKGVIVGALGYFVTPFDAIPDMMPVAGYTDDLATLLGALGAVAAHIKPEHRERARRWVEETLD